MTEKNREWMCSFYYDKEATHRIKGDIIELGRVWAGEDALIQVWVKNNDYGAIEDLKYTTDREDVGVSGPDKLLRTQTGLILIRWVPGFSATFGLRNELRIEGTLVLE